MITRRGVLRGLGAAVASGFALGAYAVGFEPNRSIRTTKYRLQGLSRWPADLNIKIAVIADLHACEPWVGAGRIKDIVDHTNRLNADVILLLGDYVAGHRWVTSWVHSDVWAPALGKLRAPLGVHAILGNHDWWEDKTAQKQGHGPVFSQRALEAANIKVYENDVMRLSKGGKPFWLAGLGDQIGLLPGRGSGRKNFRGLHDLPATLAKLTDDAPVILMAHEPDIFPTVPERVALTLSGHTHGGQVRIFGYSPVVPSKYRNRYAYGHVVEDGRHLIVSGGLGCSIMPVRLGVPPEVLLVEVGA